MCEYLNTQYKRACTNLTIYLFCWLQITAFSKSLRTYWKLLLHVLYCTVPFTVRVMAPKSINNHVIGLIQHDILAFICDNTWVRRHRHKFGSSNGLLDNYNYKRVRRKIQNKTVYVNTLPFKGPRTFNVLRNIWFSDTPIKISPRLLED